MNKSKRFTASFMPIVFVFIFTLSASFIVYLYTNRNEPIVFRDSKDFLTFVFIQNPFRDKTKEKVAEDYLNSIKGKEVKDSFIDAKGVVYVKRYEDDYEQGRLITWSLQNRYDEENLTEFSYTIYRIDERVKLKWGKYLSSYVILKLTKENSEWKVKEYNCHAIPWNDW